jgi:hypothetical protein
MKERWKWVWMLPFAALALSLGCNLPVGDAPPSADIPLPNGSPLTEEQVARLREALQSETEDQRHAL